MRLVARAVAPAAARRLLPPWLLGAVALGWLWQAVDWGGLAEAAGALSPMGTGGVLLLLCALAASSRSGLRPVLHPRGMRFLYRQPISPLRWSAALAPWALALGAPAGLISLLWRVDHWVCWLLLWALATGLSAVAGTAPGWRGPALAAATGLVGAGLTAAGRARPEALPALLIPALLGAAALGPLHRAGVGPAREPAWSLPGRPRSALGALVREDLLALLRTDPGTLLGAWLALALAGLYFRLPASNGCCDRRTLSAGALLLLTLGGAAGAGVISALVSARGPGLDPPGRPISPTLRALSLHALPLLALAPLAAWLALLCGGWLSALRLGLHGWALAAGAALVGTWRAGRPFNTGAGLTWCLLAGGAALVGPWGAAGSAALSILALALTTWRLAARRRAP